MRVLLACILLLLTPSAFSGTAELILDDFENEQTWEHKEWGDKASLSLEAQPVSHGKKALLLRFDKAGGQPHPKGIVIRRSLLGKAADYQDFTLDIFVETTAPLRLGVGIEADRTYERPHINLQPGWNRNIRLEIPNGMYKGWDSELGPVDLKPEVAIGSLILSFHRDVNEGGRIALDHIRSFHRPEWTIKKPGTQKPEQHPIRIQSVSQPEGIKAYQLLELTVDLDARVMDPYDPAELDLKASFKGPDGRTWTMPGFLYRGDVSGLEPVRNAVWKVRFTPTQPGAWTYVVSAKNHWQETQTEVASLHVDAGTEDGFVRIDRKQPQYFTLDSGRFFYPIGQNVAWLPFNHYEYYFSRMAQNGQNWARIWMTNWSFGIEWKPMGQFQGLGAYNLDRAQRLDDLLALADTYGIHLQLVLDFHGAYSSKVNPEWSNNPYNIINGGFLKSPDHFFTDPQARAVYKKRLRYIAARWGYSPHVMAWEFFNEVSFTDNFNERAINAWHQEMGTFMKQIDPHQHLITTSYGGDAIGEVYQLPQIDFSQYHIYAPHIHKQVQRISNKLSQYKKPHFIGEFGSDSANGKDDQDKSGVFLHAGLWSQFMQPASGNAMPWWWDSHIEPNDLYYHFGALGRFAAGVDRRRYTFTPLAQKLRMEVGPAVYEFELTGLQSPDFSMFWLCDSLGMRAGHRSQALAYEEVKIALTGFAGGHHEVEFWDTYQGKVIQTVKLEPQNGQLALTLPYFSNDIAFKIRSTKTLAHNKRSTQH